MNNSHNPGEPTISTEFDSVAQKLFAYCQANDWAGHDPYDALNSRLFLALPFLNHRIPRLVLTQTLKRLPFSLRTPLQIPKTQNAKGIALFLSAILKAPKLKTYAKGDVVGSLTETLLGLRSPNTEYWCWGYSFPWQTRTKLVPRAEPNLVCAMFVATALLDLFEQRRDPQHLDIAVSAAEFMLKELYWTEGSVAGFAYPLPTMRNQVHNANLLAAALFCRVSRLTGNEKFIAPALKAARFSAACQQQDGSWRYGEGPSQEWVDNFHTGYNLGALREIDHYLDTREFESNVGRGFAFYKAHFFREDGAPRYFHNETYPIDVHCVAQSIITLLTFKDLDTGNVALAHSVFRWAVQNMWDDRGFFYYRVLRVCTIRTSYMRWSQAWMLMAIAALLAESNGTSDRELTFSQLAAGER